MSEILRTIQLSNRMDMRMPEGSIYGLLGPNGAGKSTTLQILMNIHRPSSGHAEIFGHDSRRISPQDFIEIGYVAESQNMPDWMTIADFMAYLRLFIPIRTRSARSNCCANSISPSIANCVISPGACVQKRRSLPR